MVVVVVVVVATLTLMLMLLKLQSSRDKNWIVHEGDEVVASARQTRRSGRAGFSGVHDRSKGKSASLNKRDGDKGNGSGVKGSIGLVGREVW